MHGRKRETGQISEEEKLDRLKKIGKYTKLVDSVLQMNSVKDCSSTALELTKKILELNPEFSTLWNYRRNILIHCVDSGEKKISDIVDIELALVVHALEKNPKSYCAWHHRAWTVSLGCTCLKSELELCSKFLKLDSRNFHCWDYRRFIVSGGQLSASNIPMIKSRVSSVDLPTTPKQEFEYTSSKITENFSNFSAWHYRSKLYPVVFSESEIVSQLETDFLLIREAFYTEPDDQSAWLYHHWLISTIQKHIPPCSFIELLHREVGVCEELLSVEPNCRLCQVTLARMCTMISTLSSDDLERENSKKKIIPIYVRLMELDPFRKAYYNDLILQNSI